MEAELTLEELVHGRPLSEDNFHLSVALGTSAVGEFSLSYQWGFFGLAPHTAACPGEAPPALHNWTRSSVQEERIHRLFPLCETLDATPSDAGVSRQGPLRRHK